MESYLGIDLGTTNSVASIVMTENNKIDTPLVRIDRIKNIRGQGEVQFEQNEILPSYYTKRDLLDGDLHIVGDFAKEIYKTQPFSVVKSVKSYMGNKCLLNNKKPEEISAEILKCIKKSTEEQYYSVEKDVVIAVPASFNLAQRQATLKSAEIAGFNVRNEEGNYKENILISEPEAVLYNVINKVQNGDINLTLDFKTNKNILIFDIGGGTLDVTLHNVVRNKEIPEIFDVKPIAISRYSNIAGDIFDEVIGEKLFQKYLDELQEQDKGSYDKILKSKDMYLTRMITYAEQLKVAINSKFKAQSYRGIEFNRSELVAYGGDMYIGHSSENRIKVSDYEKMLSKLLGNGLVFNDYKKIDSINDNENIIYPILDVLNEASKTLGDVTVDGVILNGGMSKLYLIEERISEFFGLKAIKVNDPDVSVAQGASVYHYYLKNSGLENHKSFASDDKKFQFVDTTEESIAKIRTTSNILNDDIYIGVTNGYVHKIAERGQVLPYISSSVHSFQMLSGHRFIEIPVKVFDGKKYKTIATATLDMSNKKLKSNNIDVTLEVSRSQIIKLELYQDERKIDTMTIELGEETTVNKKDKRGKKMLSTNRIKVDPKQEINTLIQLSQNTRNKRAKNEQINQRLTRLKNCLNPEDFADEIILKLSRVSNVNEQLVLLRLTNELIGKWSNAEKMQFEKVCLYIITSLTLSQDIRGYRQQVLMVAISLLKYSTTKNALNTLDELILKGKFRNPVLNTLGHLGYRQDYIYKCLNDDIKQDNKLNDALKALGISVLAKKESDINLRKAFVTCKNIVRKTVDNQELNNAIQTLSVIGEKLNLLPEVSEIINTVEKNNTVDEKCLNISNNSKDIVVNYFQNNKMQYSAI